MNYTDSYFIYASDNILNHSIVSYHQALILKLQFEGIIERLHPVYWNIKMCGIFSLN
jgi:hypothetical protein